MYLFTFNIGVTLTTNHQMNPAIVPTIPLRHYHSVQYYDRHNNYGLLHKCNKKLPVELLQQETTSTFLGIDYVFLFFEDDLYK